MRDSVVAVIQARTGSARLPNKVLLPLGDRTVLEQMVRRVMRARLVDDVVIATTTLPADTPIVAVASASGVPCLRGDPVDLLDRHRQVARACWAAHVVKIPSDCPLIDPDVIDAVILAYLGSHGRIDYASNLHPPTHPDGNDVEIMSHRVLEQAWQEATLPFEREHTTPFIWDRPERFRLANVQWDTGEDLAASHRYVLDHAEDYEVITAIFGALTPIKPDFTIGDIVAYLDAHPDVARLNAHHRGEHWHHAHRHQLRTLSGVRE